MSGKSKSKSLVAVVEDDPKSLVSNAGNSYLSFILNDSDKLFKCIVLDESVLKALKGLKKGMRGAFLLSSGTDDTWFVTYASLKGVISYSSELSEGEKAFLRSYEDKLRDDGFVRVKLGGKLTWVEKERCVEHEGIWYPWVEFVCDKLGDKEVNAMFKEFTKGKINLNMNLKSYEQFKQDLIDLAKNTLLPKQGELGNER